MLVSVCIFCASFSSALTFCPSRPLSLLVSLQWWLRLVARNPRLQQWKMLCLRQVHHLMCLTVSGRQHFQTSFLSYCILRWFYICNLDSLKCKRAVLEKDILYWMVESSCPCDVSDKTGHVLSAWKLSQLSWNFIVNCIVFKNSTDFQFSFLASVNGALFNGIFIIWPTKARTPIIPYVEVLCSKHSS